VSRRGGGADGPHGVAVVDKEAGWTSHDVVAKARGLLGTRKVGHAGTLDPDATGVLVLGVGRATRLLRFLTVLPKAYEAEIVLGAETDTLDASGNVTATHDMTGVDEGRVRAAAAGLTGEVLQVPPMVSAVKVGGRRLHELARQGLEVERDARAVTVHRFDVAPDPGGDPLVWRAEVECSSGTYVRTLAADLGAALGGGAHLRALRRTAVGPFTVSGAVPVPALDPARLRPVADAVAGLVRVDVADPVAGQVAHGAVLPVAELGDPPGPGPWAVFGGDGRLLAVYEAHRGGTAKPTMVLAG
jgi:tRNA pseudouridine55 synthase